MRSPRRTTGLALHLLLIGAVVVTATRATATLGYRPLTVAAAVLVTVPAAVTLLGRFPLGLGPPARTATAAAVRAVGLGLAAAGAVEVILGLTRAGSAPHPAVGGVPAAAVVLAVVLAAFQAVTRRDGGLPRRALLTGVGFGLPVAVLFAGAVPVLPPELVWWVGFLLIAAAVAGAARLNRPAEVAVPAALFATVVAGQALFLAAAVLYHYGPDAWMPYAGPGPLTAQGQLEQNRAEAIDPYAGLLLLAAVAATILTVQAVNARAQTTITANFRP